MWSVIVANEILIDGCREFDEYCIYYGEDKKEAAKALKLSRKYDHVCINIDQNAYSTYQLRKTDCGNYYSQPWMMHQNEETIPF